jgi:RNA polymerase sigma-70 factor (ECF subfamily)
MNMHRGRRDRCVVMFRSSSPQLDVCSAPLSAAMASYARGEQQAFAVIHSTLEPRLRRILRRRGCSDTVADDILQQTFLKLHTSRAHYRSDRALMPWASTIALRLAIDGWRKAEQALPEPEHCQASSRHDPEEQLLASELSRALRESLARLPHAQREAFELVKLQGWSLEQVAEHTGSTTLAVKLRVHRALESLRRTVANDNAR